MPPQLLAMVVIALLGAGLRRAGILTRSHLERLVHLVFRISLPATILVSIDRLTVASDLWRLPVTAWLVILSLLPCAWLLSRRLDLPRAAAGTVLVGSSVMNMAFFAYAVVLSLFGEAGLGRALFFDLGHGLLVFTLIYGIAVRFGGRATSPPAAIGRFLGSPPLWAIIVSTGLRACEIHLPDWGRGLLFPLHLTTMPLASLILGLSIDMQTLSQRVAVAAAAVMLRMGGGGVMGWWWSGLLGLSDFDRTIVTLSAAMPVGLNTLVFAAEEELDQDLAAAMITLSIGIGLLLLPALPWLLGLLGRLA
ncbi:MAG: AEC family transporter [Nitrospiraceae bacterium]|nr:AEC family transporter [Nitrospiraceae bacterium]